MRNITTTESIEEVAAILTEANLEFALEELYFMLAREGEYDLALETVDGLLESVKDGFYDIDDIINVVCEVLAELTDSFVEEYVQAIA